MAEPANKIDVYLEIGKKRAFAGALGWPGWCRSGRDEASALQALWDYRLRYANVLDSAEIEFQLPPDKSAFVVVERLEGNATTDFGAPVIAPSSDSQPVDDAQLLQFQALLGACWRTLDASCNAAEGVELRKGPRGGGRELDQIIQHTLGADQAYLSKLGWKLEKNEALSQEQDLLRTRQAILSALEAAVQGKLPSHGPRGSIHWTVRYFVRRSAWHVLDHAWEIEDRMR